MKKLLTVFLLALCLLSGCAAQTAPAPAATPEPQTEQTAPAEPAAPDTSAVADASQMTTVEDVVDESMVPVPASKLAEGSYEIAVDCSSSMFKIERCELTVADGAMTVELTMGSDAYGYLFPGTAEEAAASDETRYLTPTERRFVFAVDALDAPVQCAAWSVKKELWYDRTLVFRSDSLPLTAFRSVTTAESLGLADGAYFVEVTLSGGSGRASVQSPAALTVADGAATARIVWSSANYDYMLVDGARYDAAIEDGHSVFEIPVAAFDRPLAVVADTTAMSQPHEIGYTLSFDSARIAAS